MSGPEQRLVNIWKVGKISERESFPSFTRPIHLHPLLCPWTCGRGDLVGYMGEGGKTFRHSATTGYVQASCFGDVIMLLI